VGWCVGCSVGDATVDGVRLAGWRLGCSVGRSVGRDVTSCVGVVGCAVVSVGLAVGVVIDDGARDRGCLVGWCVGCFVGWCVGWWLGCLVG